MRILLGTILSFLFAFSGWAQDVDISLYSAKFNDDIGKVEVLIRALERDGDPMVNLQPQNIRIQESVNEGPLHNVSITSNLKELVYDTVNLREDTVQVLFIIDKSQSVNDLQLDRSKRAIEKFFGEARLGRNANYYLLPFGEDFSTTPTQIDINSYASALARIDTSSEASDLYRVTIAGLRFLEPMAGKKLIFLLSAGVDQSDELARYASGPKMAPRRSDVMRIVQEFDDDLYLFPINPSSGMSDSTGFLADLCAASRRTDDRATTNGIIPPELDRILDTRQVLLYTHRMEIESPVGIFSGLPRELLLSWSDSEDILSRFNYRAGKFFDKKVQGNRRTAQSYTLGAGVGIGLVSMLLIIFSLLYPKLQQINFRKKHLKPYQPQAGRQVMDPLTREPIQAGEMVVDICRLAIPWQTWQECGHTCPRFPGCTTSNLQCKGQGGVATSGFFSLQGPHRRLNWIWYGALGGFIAWIIAGFVFVFGQNLVSSLGLAGADDLIEDTMLGAAFGFGISLMLSVIEERTESRRFSISRILMRTLLATVLAVVVFGGSYMLFDSGIIASPLIVGAIAWIFLGLSIGFVLSLFGSSVSLGRGLIGGLLAGIVGFGFYTLLGELSEDFLLAKVVSLVAGGAVLGGVLDTVVQLSESFEMEFLQPATYRRNVPLSKWLGTGSEIIIGTQPGSQVYVKWPDEAVLPEHAKIKLEGERVFLIPMAETLVNGHIVNQKRIQLQDKDLIQLGRNAITQMRFLQKQEAK